MPTFHFSKIWSCTYIDCFDGIPFSTLISKYGQYCGLIKALYKCSPFINNADVQVNFWLRRLNFIIISVFDITVKFSGMCHLNLYNTVYLLGHRLKLCIQVQINWSEIHRKLRVVHHVNTDNISQCTVWGKKTISQCTGEPTVIWPATDYPIAQQQHSCPLPFAKQTSAH